MRQFMQYVISGLATGSIYALVALGLALIYRSTRILNFAHGDMATAGTFVSFSLLGMNLAPIISFPFAVFHLLLDDAGDNLGRKPRFAGSSNRRYSGLRSALHRRESSIHFWCEKKKLFIVDKTLKCRPNSTL